MGQQEVLKLLAKYPKGLTVKEMHEIFKNSRANTARSVMKLRESEDIMAITFEKTEGRVAPRYVLK